MCVVVGRDDEAATSAFNLTRDPPPHEARTELRAIEGLGQATARRLHSRSRLERVETSFLVSDRKYQTSATAITLVNSQTSRLHRSHESHQPSDLLPAHQHQRRYQIQPRDLLNDIAIEEQQHAS